ncbi:MAG TPA: hypothetical protein VL728_03235 [Cyclobacteriaceae bacterium]|nr:hypothetical protein [Cyclobacteriaceae bacterium]
MRLDSLLKKVSKQTGLVFSYNSRKINPSLLLSFTTREKTLKEILSIIKEKTGLDYLLADNHIVLKSVKRVEAIAVKPSTVKEEQADISKAAPPPVNNAARTNTQDSIANHKTSNVGEDSTAIPTVDSEIGISDSIKKQELSSDSTKRQLPTSSPRPSAAKEDSAVQKSKKPSPVKSEKSKARMPLQMKVGIGADETTYLGSTLQLGVPALYGTISYKTDFVVGLFSYGLGTSIKVNETWRVNLYGNTGNVSRSYDSLTYTFVDSTIVARHRIIVAKGTLIRVGISVEKKINSRLSIQGGIQYNSLTTKYSLNGIPIPIGPYGSNADKEIYALAPPYSLSNSYGPSTTSNVKSWLGVQVGLFYLINFSKGK